MKTLTTSSKITAEQAHNDGTSVIASVVWGVNKFGQKVKEHDKLSCGSGINTWFTHVIFDTERNCWHREQDYYHNTVVGSYNEVEKGEEVTVRKSFTTFTAVS